ncbi:hypothetical protein LBMAG18_13130 [Alphaproteobacteria bacterium]|nr:hypothetical protein LBMAG18_13130 [Alphaproteobacteria bacterium]
MKIIFLCEASLQVGTGHVVRCLTLAKALNFHENQIIFLTSKNSIDLIEKIKEFKIIDPVEFLAIPFKADFAIIDNYQIDYVFENKIRKYAKKIMVIDDLFNRQHDCDILLDQNLGAKKSYYKNLVNKDCKIFTGTKYALLRPEYSELRKAMFKKRKHTQKIKKILVNFGGSDLNNYSLKALKMIEESSFIGEINVVLGFKALHLVQIKEFAKTSKNIINIFQEVDMAQMIFDADIGVGAGGTSTWERCCLGLPTYLFKIADNQELIFKKLGQDISFEEFLTDVNSNYCKIVKTISKYVDGKGIYRIKKIIKSLH